MDNTNIWSAVTALIVGATGSGAWGFYKFKRLQQREDKVDIITAKDKHIESLQEMYLNLERKLSKLHDEFLESEKERSNLNGRVIELEHHVKDLEEKVVELETENRILRAENGILKNK